MMASPVTMSETNHVIYNRTESVESGWENPFRPGGDLSREADEIVELIKGGKPITPTPGQAPSIPDDQLDGHHQQNSVHPNQEPVTQSPKKATQLNSTPKSANGTTKVDAKPGAVDVQRTTLKPQANVQVEHVNIKKKPKCKCCVIQ